jgi:hypothetical protein
MIATSKDLFQFIKSNFASTLRGAGPTFSKKSCRVLRALYKHILTAHHSWNNDEEKIASSSLAYISPHGPFSKCTYLRYVPAEIQTELEESVKWERVFECNISGRIIQITMVYPVQDAEQGKTEIIQFFHQALFKIYLWLYVIDAYAPKVCAPTISIYFYFTHHMKIIAGSKKDPLSVIHANTAFATSCAKNSEIIIFRREEWFKAFIHETMHAFGIDFSSMSKNVHNKTDQKMWELFPIKTEVRLYETYCETWAELINMLFMSFLGTQNKMDWSLILHKFERTARYEAMWSAFQCVKVLHHYDLTYEQFTNRDCPRSRYMRDTQYHEKSHVLAYYIIKAVFMTQPNEFLEWNAYYHGNKIEFTKSWTNIVAYCLLITTLYKTPQFLRYIGGAEELFRRSPEIENTLYGKTMRMTLFE